MQLTLGLLASGDAENDCAPSEQGDEPERGGAEARRLLALNVLPVRARRRCWARQANGRAGEQAERGGAEHVGKEAGAWVRSGV